MSDLRSAQAAKQHLRERLAGRADVRGVGITRRADGYALQVNVVSPSGPAVPSTVDGVRVRVRVVGEIGTHA